MVHTKSFLIPLFNSLSRPPIIFYFFMKTHGININNNNNNHNNNNNNNNHFTIVITIKILLKMLYHFFQKCNESFFSTESGTSSSQSKLFAIWTRPREQYIMIISYDNIICTPCICHSFCHFFVIFISTESRTSSSQPKLLAIWTRPQEQYIMIMSYNNIICATNFVYMCWNNAKVRTLI